MREALLRTSQKRDSLQYIENWEGIVSSLRTSDIMRQVWKAYTSDNAYAKDVTFDETLDSIEILMRSMGQ